jgi:hypothetical protein
MTLTLTYLSETPEGGALHEAAMRILEDHMENSEPESHFGKFIRGAEFAGLGPRDKIYVLLKRDFDALLCYENEELKGYLAIRRDRSSGTVHLFRAFTLNDYQTGNAFSKAMKRLLDDSVSYEGTLLRFSDSHPAAKRALQILKRRYADAWGIDVSPETGEVRRKG